jgi:hypothetical protein
MPQFMTMRPPLSLSSLPVVEESPPEIERPPVPESSEASWDVRDEDACGELAEEHPAGARTTTDKDANTANRPLRMMPLQAPD